MAPRGASTARQKRVRALDRRVARAARKVRVLSHLSWPGSVSSAFLRRWRRGRAALPEVHARALDAAPIQEPLRAALTELDAADPLQAFLGRTARSYLRAAELLATAGTPAFRDASVALFGHPLQPVVPGGPSLLETAQQFIADTEGVDPGPAPDAPDADAAAAWLRARLAGRFDPPLRVEVTRGLRALATAGSRRIRLRAGARFDALTLEQLLQHEALVHAATKRSGRQQPILSCLGLSSPRTTATQEGLATLAEMVTDVMDLHRLRRIALRVPAVQMALDGADFIEVFEYFVAHGQAPEQACMGAARIFRGGDVRGGVVLTKDIVYIGGLMRTHAFLLKAAQAGRPELVPRLFCGRLTEGDVLALEPAFADGTIAPALLLPPWVAEDRCLRAWLAWSAFAHRVPIRSLSLADFAPADSGP